jgi:hypothetical protein
MAAPFLSDCEQKESLKIVFTLSRVGYIINIDGVCVWFA